MDITNINFYRILSGYLMALVIISASCSEGRKDIPMNNISSRDAESFKKLAVENGDTDAYSALRDYYMDVSKESLLLTALIMANKYDYPPAYYDVYESLTALSNQSEYLKLSDLDDKTRQSALDYLIAGAAKGDPECKGVLGHYYLVGTFVQKDTIKGRQLLDDAEN